MKDDRMSILIMSCDKNVDVLQYGTVLFEKYWGDCSFPVYIVSESKTVESRYKSILCGKESTWTKEVLYAIEKVPGEYVLILMDDGFLHSNVQNDEIVKIVDFVYENEIKYYRIPRMKNNYRKEADYPGKNECQ